MRHLDWEGCFNARDLGGLVTSSGLPVARGALVRSDALDHLTPDGWRALEAHGIRTIIDLRNDDERSLAPRRDGIAMVHLPLDNIEDTAFWSEWTTGWQFGTPLFYKPHVERFPQRSARVVAAIAEAEPGGVVVHCGVGRDRTGLIVMLVLSLIGVSADAIAADHALSRDRLPPLFARRGEADQGPSIDAFLTERGTSSSEIIGSTLEKLDLGGWRHDGGLEDRHIAALRARLLAPL